MRLTQPFGPAPARRDMVGVMGGVTCIARPRWTLFAKLCGRIPMKRDGMHDRKVIAFHKVLDERFPIRVPDFLSTMDHPIGCGVIGLEPFMQSCEVLIQIGGCFR